MIPVVRTEGKSLKLFGYWLKNWRYMSAPGSDTVVADALREFPANLACSLEVFALISWPFNLFRWAKNKARNESLSEIVLLPSLHYDDHLPTDLNNQNKAFLATFFSQKDNQIVYSSSY